MSCEWSQRQSARSEARRGDDSLRLASRRFKAILPCAYLGGLPFATNVSCVVEVTCSRSVAHVSEQGGGWVVWGASAYSFIFDLKRSRQLQLKYLPALCPAVCSRSSRDTLHVAEDTSVDPASATKKCCCSRSPPPPFTSVRSQRPRTVATRACRPPEHRPMQAPHRLRCPSSW